MSERVRRRVDAADRSKVCETNSAGRPLAGHFFSHGLPAGVDGEHIPAHRRGTERTLLHGSVAGGSFRPLFLEQPRCGDCGSGRQYSRLFDGGLRVRALPVRRQPHSFLSRDIDDHAAQTGDPGAALHPHAEASFAGYLRGADLSLHGEKFLCGVYGNESQVRVIFEHTRLKKTYHLEQFDFGNQAHGRHS